MIKRVALACLMVGSQPALAGVVERSISFGSVEMVEEVRVRDPGEPAIMHTKTEWTKFHLRWRSSDQIAAFTLTDDGSMVTSKFNVGDCLISRSGNLFVGIVGERKLLNQAFADLRKILRMCPGLAVLERQRLANEFAGSADDFVPAVEALKKRGATKFGTWRRPFVDQAGVFSIIPCLASCQSSKRTGPNAQTY